MDLTSDFKPLVKKQNDEEYLLEYLALLVDGKSFDEALKEFIENFSLTIEEFEKGVYIIASGSDFAIQAKSITSGSTASKALLLKVSTEGEYDLQNARELLEEKAVSIIFMDLVLLRDSVGERRNQQAYILLNELENMLRKIVAVRTASIAGKDWWNERVENCITKGHIGRKKNELEDLEVTHRTDQTYHEIFYIDLSALKNIIEEANNWKDGFANDLKVLRNLERLDFLNRLRRKIAHNRFLSQRNFDDLRQIHGHLMHLCRRALGEL